MFSLYDEKYHVFEANTFTLIKSMTFFIDADTDDMPQMLVPHLMGKDKTIFSAEAIRLGK